MRTERTYFSRGQGFTLVEMIVVIVISGIIASIVAVFIPAPVKGYVDSARRAELTDIADTALRRMARDIRTAVPNSVRPSPASNSQFIEFLPTKSGGRYRADAASGNGGCGAAGDDLDFTVADSCFEIIGPAMTFAAGDHLVVGSTQSDASLPYNTTMAGVLRAITTVGTSAILSFTATQFPASAELPSQRFQVVDGAQKAVTYVCSGVGTDANGTGTGQLRRHWNYGFNAAPSATPGGTSALLADKVSACRFDYEAINANFGLVSMRLTVQEAGEAVSLYHQVHVNNIP